MSTKAHRRNPARRSRKNPSMLVTALVSGGAAIASVVIVAVAMQQRRNKALQICARIGTLVNA